MGQAKFQFEAYTKMTTECNKFDVIDSSTSTESIGDISHTSVLQDNRSLHRQSIDPC